MIERLSTQPRHCSTLAEGCMPCYRAKRLGSRVGCSETILQPSAALGSIERSAQSFTLLVHSIEPPRVSTNRQKSPSSYPSSSSIIPAACVHGYMLSTETTPASLTTPGNGLHGSNAPHCGDAEMTQVIQGTTECGMLPNHIARGRSS